MDPAAIFDAEIDRTFSFLLSVSSPVLDVEQLSIPQTQAESTSFYANEDLAHTQDQEAAMAASPGAFVLRDVGLTLFGKNYVQLSVNEVLEDNMVHCTEAKEQEEIVDLAATLAARYDHVLAMSEAVPSHLKEYAMLSQCEKDLLVYVMLRVKDFR